MTRDIDSRAGTPALPEELISRAEMEVAYHRTEGEFPPIKNGTSGHRGLTGEGFTERHVAAMVQALIDIRNERGSFGPELPASVASSWGEPAMGGLVLGKDVRFTSDFALHTTVEVCAGNEMPVLVDRGERATPTPVVSRTILRTNSQGGNVEGVIVTASHNPPAEAGLKSNGRDGGPNTRTKEIDERANYYLAHPEKVKRVSYDEARRRSLIREDDLMTPYIEELSQVIDFDVMKGARFAATSLGGSANGYYQAIAERFGISITELIAEPDPAGAAKCRDWDGKLRGDPSSQYVMKAVEGFRERLDVPFVGANDNDADRFGGEDATAGVLNPNHVLCVLANYLFTHRQWPKTMGIGRTIGTTHMLDLIAADHNRPVHEVNVGFKYFVKGLLTGSFALAGEESAGLCIPRKDGGLWVTEKDGILAVLLIMEMIARTGDDVGTLYSKLEQRYGRHHYERVDSPATLSKKRRLQQLAADPQEVIRRLKHKKIAGRTVTGLVVGDGVKVVLQGGVWVLKRPSGTENIIKDYREERGDSLDTARRASIEIDSLLELPD